MPGPNANGFATQWNIGFTFYPFVSGGNSHFLLVTNLTNVSAGASLLNLLLCYRTHHIDHKMV